MECGRSKGWGGYRKSCIDLWFGVGKKKESRNDEEHKDEEEMALLQQAWLSVCGGLGCIMS